MSKFTEGEWFAKRDGWSTVYVECRIGGGMLQEVAACGPTASGPDEQEANARLIAAAPDLLEALELVLERPLTGNPSHERLVEHWEYEKKQGNGYAEDQLFALAAIARARGEA